VSPPRKRAATSRGGAKGRPGGGRSGGGLKVVRNDRLARRRGRQASALSIVGLSLLGAGLVVNFRGQIGAAYLMLIAGSAMSWAGIALGDTWLKPPRPDKVLGDAFSAGGKGLALYHWALPPAHVLLGPWGLTVLLPSGADGLVTASPGRWKEQRPLRRRLTSIGRRPLGKPPDLAELQVDDLSAALAAREPEAAPPPIDAVIVFLNPAVELEGADERLPMVRAADLRSWLATARKRPSLDPVRRRELEAALDAMAAERMGVDVAEGAG
jgi:hypothetical protein